MPSCNFFALLDVDDLQHHGNRLYLSTWCNGEYILIKMNGASLLMSIQKHFRYGL